LTPELEAEASVWELVLSGLPLESLERLDLEEIDKLIALKQMQQDYQMTYQHFIEAQRDN
jgi:hypothetical protein